MRPWPHLDDYLIAVAEVSSTCVATSYVDTPDRFLLSQGTASGYLLRRMAGAVTLIMSPLQIG